MPGAIVEISLSRLIANGISVSGQLYSEIESPNRYLRTQADRDVRSKANVVFALRACLKMGLARTLVA